VESNPRNVIVVTLEGHDRVWIRGLNIVKPDDMATSSGEEFFVGGDAEAVYL
jgi:hypothetical protein